MPVPVMQEYVSSFRFQVLIDKKDMGGFSSISPIETMLKSNGRTINKPVVLERAVADDRKSLAQIFGNRPYEKKTVSLLEFNREKEVVRIIHLGKCKVLSLKIGGHDGAWSQVVLDTVKLRPGKINVVHNRELLDDK
jgi:hypothetical protein